MASGDTSGSATRYRLLDTTRTYAAMKLTDAGEADLLRRRHAEYYRELLRKTASQADLPADERRALATHLGDIRAALNWAFGPGGDLSLGGDLTSYSSSIWLSKALFPECPEWTTRAGAVRPSKADPAPKQKPQVDFPLSAPE